MIFIGGLSGSGKTTLCEKLAKKSHLFQHISASSILSLFDRPRRELTKEDAITNQECIIGWWVEQRFENSTLFDGHGILTIVEKPGFYRVPIDFFQQICPEKIIWVTADVLLLLSRRDWPSSLADAEKLHNLQQVEGKHLQNVAVTLGIQFEVVDGYDFVGFERKVSI